MKIKPKQLIKEATMKAIGESFCAVIFEKAYAKAKRWANNAYGSADMAELIAESGPNISSFYKECLAKPDGKKTFNRGY
jgi:hypothetical protein